MRTSCKIQESSRLLLPFWLFTTRRNFYSSTFFPHKTSQLLPSIRSFNHRAPKVDPTFVLSFQPSLHTLRITAVVAFHSSLPPRIHSFLSYQPGLAFPSLSRAPAGLKQWSRQCYLSHLKPSLLPKYSLSFFVFIPT